MFKDIADRWISALASGEYRQGGGYLKYHDGDSTRYCCLGVLCDLYAAEQLDSSVWCPPLACSKDSQESFDTPGGSSETHLPKNVRDWSGIKSDNAEFAEFCEERGDTVLNNLVDMNDCGRDFAAIAEAIIQHWEEL